MTMHDPDNASAPLDATPPGALPPPLPWSGPGPLTSPTLLPPQPPYPYVFAPLPAEPRPPRVWTALVVPVIAFTAAMIMSQTVIIAVVVARVGPQALTDQTQILDTMRSFAATPGGFLLIILPGQLAILGAALTAALLSPVPLAQRLGLNRPTLPWVAMPLLLLATPFAGYCGELLLRLTFGDDRGESLKFLNDIFTRPTGAFLVMALLLISVLPGFGEEMLFRGYVQRRLLQRWHPAFAIGVASVMFAAVHVDLAHVVGVLPLAIWLGVIGWLTGSTWPSVICHTVNNALAVAMVKSGLVDPNATLEFDRSMLIAMTITGAFTALSVWLMWRYRAKDADVSRFAATQRGALSG